MTHIQFNKDCMDYMLNFFKGTKIVSVALMNKEKVYIGYESEKGNYSLPSLLLERLITLINAYGINEENHKYLSDFYDKTLKTIADHKYPISKYRHSAWSGKIEVYEKVGELISPIRNRYIVTRQE